MTAKMKKVYIWPIESVMLLPEMVVKKRESRSKKEASITVYCTTEVLYGSKLIKMIVMKVNSITMYTKNIVDSVIAYRKQKPNLKTRP